MKISFKSEVKMEEVNFRKATIEDVGEIITLTNECFDESTPIEHAEQVFRATADDRNQIYLNGYLGEQLVAHAKITIIPTIYQPMATFAVLNHVCVKPDLRRQHLGTKLMEEIFQICREAGASTIKLWSRNFRIPAHTLYQKHGFEILDAKFFEKDI